MLSKQEFGTRFIARMAEILGEEESQKYYRSALEMAEEAYETYLSNPKDMTPEEHAEDEISEWIR